MEYMNVSFSELDLCMHVRNAMPGSITVAYWASKGRSCPIDVEKLKGGLTLVENRKPGGLS